MENTSNATVTEAVTESPKLNQTNATEGLPPAKSPKWLLWTGVLGAFLALLSLLVVMLLGQRLLSLEASQAQALSDNQQWVESQQTQWQTQQQSLLEQQQALAAVLRQELADNLAQVDARLKAREQQQPWQFTDTNIVKLMTAQLEGLSLLSVEPAALLDFIAHWQTLLAQQGVEENHPLRRALSQEAQVLTGLSNERVASVNQQTWRVWQGLIDYYAPASADGLIKPTSEVNEGETVSWWSGLLKFIRITPAQEVDASRLTQLRDASLWQTQASMALAQLRWGVQTNQPRLVQEESQQLVQLLAVMAVSLPDSMSAQLTGWQTWSGWGKPEWRHLRDYLAQPTAATQP
ncbi:MAG: hypothetical protein B7Z05_05745 [Thiotrichales bacterium 32-46-8]|nr:hypothetical protein [Gammaproteobacteria bacterium]OYX05824.1 MAG: hypothetical protein B7Z05_05745 [Thiotrichales bacterium 32-46-8]OYY25553.1 MAG: hypothetical protein B7Y68_00295 [Thiotrichales bacterium 35-46-9]OYZ07364.1 MAG: hypothetical protein B7Y29_04785 [Thiotrichales bacterium 16-46-22]OYZ42703.1 MAG: hypothetical protein B7Y18_00250 [Thiotrichales bacterium 24-47-4]OZA17511.1 MAG: hypothetical protein B7X85_05005 [Thiotrichales bacterium 17-46-47]OZA75339.1 MAG: hypothetical p